MYFLKIVMDNHSGGELGDTTLICTFYSFEPIVASATQYSPKKIILLVAKDSLKEQKVKENIEKAKNIYKNIAPISVIETNGSDLLAIAKDASDAIEVEYDAGKAVVVNVSGGWKILAQGALYGCYAREGMVYKIICNDLAEDGKIIELPKLSFGLTTIKRELLEAIADRKGRSVADIASKLDKTKGMVYQHLKELRAIGFVDDKFEITLAGRMALL